MNTDTKPYFLWDYDLTENDVRRILRGDNEVERLWMMGRILASAHFRDVWNYLTVKEVVENFPKVKSKCKYQG